MLMITLVWFGLVYVIALSAGRSCSMNYLMLPQFYGSIVLWIPCSCNATFCHYQLIMTLALAADFFYSQIRKNKSLDLRHNDKRVPMIPNLIVVKTIHSSARQK